MPTDTLAVHSTPITFEHASIDRKLIINTGMTQINWNYRLNEMVTATYGGEVTQILSVFVDKMTITGDTITNPQLDDIYEWFLEYMQHAGYHNRDERAVIMKYPERGWSFYLQITNANEFLYQVDRIGTPWTIQAEVVADNDLNYLSSHTMSSISGGGLMFDPTMYNIGFKSKDPRNDPNSSDLSWAGTIGANFQSLIASYVTGDFAHWGVDVTQPAATNQLKSAEDYYQQAFGTNLVAGGVPQSLGGAAALGNISNPVGPAQIAYVINQVFNNNHLPGKYAVAVCINESNLNPNARQGAPGVPGLGIGLFQVNQDGTGAVQPGMSHYTEVIKAGKSSEPVTNFYPTADQIADGSVNWGKYRQYTDPIALLTHAQYGAGWTQAKADAYGAHITGLLPQAQKLIDQGATFAESSGSGLAQKALQIALNQVGDPYIYGSTGPNSFDCSGLCYYSYTNAHHPLGSGFPRTSQAQWGTASFPKVEKGNYKPGDLLYYYPTTSGPDHVIMYAGNNKVVQAPHTGTLVQVNDISKFNDVPYVGANRPSP